MVPEVLITLTSSLLTVFSIQVAFLGFLCTLLFTKTWGNKGTTAFKVFISLFFVSVVIMGVTCGYLVYIGPLQEIRIMFGFPLHIVIDIVIGCLIIGGLFVTIAVWK